MILSFPFGVVFCTAPARKAKVVNYPLADNATCGWSVAFSTELYVLWLFFKAQSMAWKAVEYNSYLIPGFAFCCFSYWWSPMVWKQMVLILLNCEKVYSSRMLQCLSHSPYRISACRHFTILHHHKRIGEYSTMRYFEREREATFTYILFQYIVINYSTLLLLLLICYCAWFRN